MIPTQVFTSAEKFLTIFCVNKKTRLLIWRHELFANLSSSLAQCCVSLGSFGSIKNKRPDGMRSLAGAQVPGAGSPVALGDGVIVERVYSQTWSESKVPHLGDWP